MNYRQYVPTMHALHVVASIVTICALVISLVPLQRVAAAPQDVTIGVSAIPNPGTGGQETITLSNPEAFDVTIEQLAITDAASTPNTLRSAADLLIPANDSVVLNVTNLNNDGDTMFFAGTNVLGTPAPEVTYTSDPGENVPVTGSFVVTADDGLPVGTVRNVDTNTFYATIQEAIDDATAGDTIELTADVTTSAQVTIGTELTLDGNGFTLSPDFAETNNGNNSAVGIINTATVVVTDLVIDGVAGTDLHGVNVFNSTDVLLEGLEVNNNDFSAVNVAGSEVVIDGITTSGNGENTGFNVINAAKGTDTDQDATLEIRGTSIHDEDPEEKLHVVVSTDATPNFTDTESQYDNVTADVNAFLAGNQLPVFPDNTQAYTLSIPEPQVAPAVCSVAGIIIEYTEAPLKHNGAPVSASRRSLDALDAVAPYANFFGSESGWSESDFFSLGVEGTMTYQFTEQVAIDGAGADIAIWETTGGAADVQSQARALVEVSADGVTFVPVATITGDGTIDISATGLPFVQYVRLTDDSAAIGSADAGDGYDVDAITIIDGSCDEIPPLTCELEVISDTGTVVVDSNEFAAETYVHPRWTTSITGADWIWESALVVDPTVETARTFRETFTASGTTNAVLEIAADNQYEVTLNGVVVATSSAEDNYSSVDVIDVTSAMQQGENILDITVTNLGRNASAQSNPAGVLYKLMLDAETECAVTTDLEPVVPEPPVFTYGPYCGDGQLTGWEQCDGGENCTESCTFANQCTDLQLAKITLDENAPVSTSFDGEIYLGTSTNPIPSGTWFSLTEIGDSLASDIAKDTTGLAVERRNGELVLAAYGDNNSGDIDNVIGNIMTLGTNLGTIDESPVVGWPLEKNTDQDPDRYRLPDVFEKTTDEGINFAFYLDTGNDSASVTHGAGEVFNCPQCQAAVEARIVVNATGSDGLGSWADEIILGDGSYTTVGFGEWFPVSISPTTSSSAVMVQDPNTVTNFDAPGDKNGLFVSREDGTVRVALYGEFASTDAGYEWVDATIEVRDANITNYEAMMGGYKLESSSRSFLPTNDYDSVSVGATSVDFKLYVDTGSDGFRFDIADESIVACTLDTPIDNGPGDTGTTTDDGTGTTTDDGTGTTTNDGTGTTTDPVVTTGSSGGGSGTRVGGRTTLGTVAPTPQVLGVATSTAAGSYCPFLVDHMQMGIENSSWEVTKLQMFLSIVMRYDQPITGFFGPTTDENVKRFQQAYRDEILVPWYERGIVPHSEPTGFVYKTTRWKINDIVCPGFEEYPSFEGEDLTQNVDL